MTVHLFTAQFPFRGFLSLAKYVETFLKPNGFDAEIKDWSKARSTSFNEDEDILLFIGDWYASLLFSLDIERFHRLRKIAFLLTEGPVRADKELFDIWDKVFVPSKFNQEMFRELGVNTTIMPVGIDTDLFKPLDLEKDLDVLSVGSVNFPQDLRKNIFLIPYIQDLLKKEKLDLKFYSHDTPTLEYKDMPSLYNRAKIFINLSGCEGFNIPVLEAMACGLPVVFNDAPAHNEYAVGKAVEVIETTNLTVTPFQYRVRRPNIIDAVEKIKQLFFNSDLRRRLGEKARQKSLDFDFRKTYLPLLKEL